MTIKFVHTHTDKKEQQKNEWMYLNYFSLPVVVHDKQMGLVLCPRM